MSSRTLVLLLSLLARGRLPTLLSLPILETEEVLEDLRDAHAMRCCSGVL
jgi:hypothetical protein